MTSPAYAELGVLTNYSFLIGASHPDELVLTARALGHSAIGIADRNSLAGVVRAHVAAKQSGLKLVVGARLIPEGGPEFLCFPQDRAAYGRLSRLLTLGKRRAEKGQCRFTLAELKDHAQGQLLILLPPADLATGFADLAAELAGLWRGHLWLGISQSYQGQDRRRLLRLSALAERAGLPLLAHNDVIMHQPGRKALADVLACVRQGVSVDKAGWLIAANAERHLKPPQEMARLFRDFPSALAASQEIAARACFSLDELRHEYPDEIAPDGRAPQAVLEEATWAGAALRYPGGVPNKVQGILLHELKLIAQLDYARFFLTVADLVREARARGILCQGRGSAANSAVCYCLGITAVDPARLDLLFERFISPERNEPPDIDIDLEHERREEIIQYLYAKYGRERAGLAATVICYRSRGAVRDLGKVLGLSGDLLETIAGNIWGWSQEGVAERDLRELGLDPSESRLTLLIELMRDLIGFPRHLSQHVGGFVITKGALSELVPIENAAMEDRTVIEWDKDDLDALHILKVDVLALGMLSCIRRAFDLIQQHLGRRYDLASIPPEDPAVYDMLCDADSVGVFQVESRAQMTMLPRLRPRNFYDLVIEVAIVRPGPIQGDMVHPYLRRRQGKESVSFPSKELEAVLGKTLGVPLFQEQAMRIAIVAAGFTPGEADQLRRAMATFKRVGTIHTFREKMIEGMAARGYERDFAERCFRQIEGFGTYGFPESHAASFALLVYVSAWLKRHYPAVFAAAILNSQPMGFYAPAQLVRDAREHGVEALPPDINHSAWDCTLELAAPSPPAPRRFFPRKDAGLALRLGLRQIKSLSEAEALKVVAARGNGFSDALQLWRRAGVKPATLDILARADALSSFGLKRREALWVVKGFGAEAPPPLFALAGESGLGEEPPVFLPVLGEAGEVVADYSQLMLTLRAHPLSFLREDLRLAGYRPTADLTLLPDGRRLMTAGLVLVRQRPGSASGVIFATLEDEGGIANIVIWPDVFERHRRIVLGATLLGVSGRLQKEGAVIHLVADRLVDLSTWLARLEEQGDAKKAMQGAIARADEVKRPGRDQRDEELRKAADHWPPSRDFH